MTLIAMPVIIIMHTVIEYSIEINKHCSYELFFYFYFFTLPLNIFFFVSDSGQRMETKLYDMIHVSEL